MTSTTHHETQIVSDPAVPLVRITREFDAPREKVFRAHVDPELFARWNGPAGMETRIDRHDCRTGGYYRYVMTQDGEDYGFNGVFHEVRQDELIVQTFAFEGMPDAVSLETMEFEDLGDGRTRLHAMSLCDSFEGREQWLASGMEVGVDDGYDAIDRMLADGAL